MQRTEFVAEGLMSIGPYEDVFVFLDSEPLGRLLVDHFQAPKEHGYTRLGRVRVTIERLEEDRA